MASESEMRRNARDSGAQAQMLQRWGMMLGGGALTVSVKTWVAAGAAPFEAARQTVKVPPSPAWGVPSMLAVVPPV